MRLMIVLQIPILLNTSSLIQLKALLLMVMKVLVALTEVPFLQLLVDSADQVNTVPVVLPHLVLQEPTAIVML